MDGYFARMPFTCFKYPGFSLSTKRYHTAAKHSTAFFDSSFNHIRQNSQLQVAETLGQGTKRYPNPHPANAGTTHYLQFDYSTPVQTVVQDDENSTAVPYTVVPLLKNPINIVLPFNQDQVILSVTKNNYHEVLKKFPGSVIKSNTITSKLHAQQSSKASSSQSSHATKVDKKQIHTSASAQDKQTRPQQEPTPASSPTLVESQPAKYFSPLEINDIELSNSTFLEQQTREIIHAHETRQFEKINALYMAIKRNNIVPSREVYTIVLSSIAQRDIDDSLDEKLSTMLNVYQDLVSNKIKPDLQIYSTVIRQLLDGAITAAVMPEISISGLDFFKIAIDIFNASNSTHVQNFDSKIMGLILIGMNLYPGLVNSTSFMKIMNQQENAEKNEIYFSSLINYCKFTNDSELAISLYEEFKIASETSPKLKMNQFIIYASFISTMVTTNEIALATKFLDKLLTSIKNYEDHESKVTMLLSSYLLSLSKTNYAKSLEIWSQFNSIDWIPEFSYEFYLHLLDDSLRLAPYEHSLKLYNYMTALPRSPTTPFTKASTTSIIDDLQLNTLLIAPRKIDSLSNFLLSAIQNDDKSTVLKMVKESFVRKFHFNYNIYPTLFRYISNEDLIVRVTNTHGLLAEDGYDFLTFLTTNVANLPIFDIAKTEFFKKLIGEFSLESTTPKNYYGFLQAWISIINVNEMSPGMLELCSPLIIEFHDLNNYYAQLPSQEVLDLKMALTDYFIRLSQEVKTDGCSEQAQQAIALIRDMNLMT